MVVVSACQLYLCFTAFAYTLGNCPHHVSISRSCTEKHHQMIVQEQAYDLLPYENRSAQARDYRDCLPGMAVMQALYHALCVRMCYCRNMSSIQYPEMTNMAYLASSGLCIGAIACLSNQKTARVGNALGLMGVGGGIAATLGAIGGDAPLYGQILGKSQLVPVM